MSARGYRRVRGITLRLACAQLAARPVTQAHAALQDVLAAIRRAKRLGAELVVFPECSYPGYVLLDADPYRRPIRSDAEALRAIARQAASSSIDVCVGVARRHTDGLLRNEAVYLDATGEELGTYAKCRLWNFDRRWFAQGRSLPVVSTRFGTIGMMICADGRNPEIARTLVANGAWLILDPTAWVGSGPTHDAVRNPQADYALRARAAENGVWIAAADKCGSELGAVHYAGRSQVVAPDGTVVAIADSTKPQIIIAGIRATTARPFIATISATDRAALRTHVPRSASSRRMPPRVWLGIYQSSPRSGDDELSLRAIKVQGVSAVIRSAATSAAVRQALRRVRGLRCAVFEGEELLAPEPARAAALRGADLLVWMRPPVLGSVLDIARTRGLENRTYVALCPLTNRVYPACLIAPDGSIAASALAGVASGFAAAVDTILARRKEVVPNTQTFADRQPQLYRWLSRSNTGKVRVLDL